MNNEYPGPGLSIPSFLQFLELLPSNSQFDLSLPESNPGKNTELYLCLIINIDQFRICWKYFIFYPVFHSIENQSLAKYFSRLNHNSEILQWQTTFNRQPFDRYFFWTSCKLYISIVCQSWFPAISRIVALHQSVWPLFI